MKAPFRIRYFAHSFVSDWNHGNVHFLRGLVQKLTEAGHEVRGYEELGAWSLSNLVRNEGETAIGAIDEFRAAYPKIDVRFYKRDETLPPFLDEQLQDADIVIIHEWNDPQFANQVLALKDRYGFKAFFHDTHHRAYSALNEILKFHLHKFDGVLAFGEAIRNIYQNGLGIDNVWVFHEAADTDKFHPLHREKSIDVCWVGNWGDDERTRELEEFLIRPAAELGCRTVVHGVRYPEKALEKLSHAGIEYRGYLPNLRAPEVYASSAISLHVPRRQYANGLAGVPTIRVFEALACGAPLLCAPWQDAEHLFRPNEDYLVADDGAAMKSEIAHLLKDARARTQLGEAGRNAVLARHTCRHRAEQLVGIFEEMSA